MKSISEMLKTFEERERKELLNRNRMPGQKVLFGLGAVAVFLMIISIVWAWGSRYQEFLEEYIWIAHLFVLISLLMAFFGYIWVIVFAVRVLWKEKTVFISLLRSADCKQYVQDLLDELGQYTEDQLISARRAIDEEVYGFQNRVSMLVGSVRRTGFLPGLFAFMLAAPNVLGGEQTTWFGDSALIIAASYLALYVAALMMQPDVQRLERYSRLISFAIEDKRRS